MAATIEELSKQFAQLTDGDLTLLPDPEPGELWCPIISVDDHLFEPASVFDRVPARLRDAAPKLVEVDGRPVWQIGDQRHYLTGADGAVGRPRREARQRGMRVEQYRRGVWDVDARVRDMDLNGVWASLCFPSITWGFAGTALSKLPDPEVALACVRAYNDWVVEDWCGSHPDRLIPCQLPFLADPALAAEEIRRNAARGVHAVSFSENPTGLGYPSIHSGHWDPFFAACEETGTVINLHVGSSGTVMRPSADAPDQVIVALFPVSAMSALVDWVFSKVAIRFPEIRIALSEGGASWVPTVLERLQRAYDRREESDTWTADDPHPVELVHRNFWFTSIEDPSAFRMLDLIGEGHVMVETDYPHADSSWPNSQELFRRDLGHLPVETIRKLCFENAAALYQHPLPPERLLAAATAFGGSRLVIPDGQVEDLVQPVPENTRHVEAGPLSFGVEFRELNARVIRETYGHDPEAMKFFESMMDIDDVGITLHVYSREDGGLAERLRFDAFGDHPHYHYVFPDGSHQKVDYDSAACGEMLPWALQLMEERLPEMLRRAGAADVAERIDPAEIRAAVPAIIDTAERLLAQRGEHAERS